jgi:glycosyltransferase involved in cell wall biosynthesis
MDSFPNSVDSSTFRRNVIMPGYVSEAELSWLLRNCFALVYPSLFEGFGMPVAEALSVGTPVICSNTSSLPEVAGDAALYCDPLDPQSIAAAMKRLWTGEVDRQQLKNAAVIQARRFSWDASAAQLLELYEHVMSIGHLHPAPGH